MGTDLTSGLRFAMKTRKKSSSGYSQAFLYIVGNTNSLCKGRRRGTGCLDQLYFKPMAANRGTLS